jgi:hypothetical protein
LAASDTGRVQHSSLSAIVGIGSGWRENHPVNRRSNNRSSEEFRCYGFPIVDELAPDANLLADPGFVLEES